MTYPLSTKALRAFGLLLSGGSMLLLGALPAAAAGPVVKLSFESGDKVSDIASVVAKVTPDGDTGIEKVEFAVDNQLKATDSSTPYSFDWDTLAETEGSHTISATAFDAKGRTATSKVTISVDNELGKGADFHAEAALAALKSGDIKAATNFSRRALKIAPTSWKAARALAGIHREKGEYAQATAILEKAEIPESETAARAELVALYVLSADQSDSTEAFLTGVAGAADAYRQLSAVRVAAAGAGETDSVKLAIAKGDAYFAAHDFGAAAREYQKTGGVDTAPLEALNRLILAYISVGRNRDADTVAKQLTRSKRADAVTQTLIGLMLFNDHQLAKARTALAEGIESSLLPALIVGAYTDMAMGQSRRARDEARQAVEAAPDLAEVKLLKGYLDPEPLDAKKAFVESIALNPLMPEAFVQRGFQILLSRGTKKYEAADAVLDYAMKLDPNSTYALMAKAVSMMAQRRPNEAEPILVQILKQDPTAPDAHVAQALNYSLQDKGFKVTEELNAALKIDPDRWNDVFVPKPTELVPRVYKYRVNPVLTPASLYPGK